MRSFLLINVAILMSERKALYVAIAAFLSTLLLSPVKNIVTDTFPEINPFLIDPITAGLVAVIVFLLVKKLRKIEQ